MAAKKGKKGKKASKKKGSSLFERLRLYFGSFAWGQEVDEETSDHFQEIKGLCFMGFAIWLFLSLMSYGMDGTISADLNWGGQAGWYFASWIFGWFGWSAYCLVFLFLSWGIVMVTRKEITWPSVRIFGALTFLFSTAFMFELAFGGLAQLHGLPHGPGGYLALELAGVGHAEPLHEVPLLVAKLGGPGLWMILSLATLISFMLATEMAFYPALNAFSEWRKERAESESMLRAVGRWSGRLFAGLWGFLRGEDLEETPAEKKKAKAADKKKGKSKAKPKKRAAALIDDPELEEEEDDEEYEWVELAEGEEPEDGFEYEYEEVEEEEDEEEEELEEEEDVEVVPAAKAKRESGLPKKPARQATFQDFEMPTPPPGEWTLPPLELLEPPFAASVEDAALIQKQADRLEAALKSFKVDAQVVDAQVGPSVTMYELAVSEGTRMNRVTSLSSEITAALRARSVRIIAPIPGRSTIGIEVPNKNRRTVRLSELVTQKAYDKKFAALPMFLGVDAEGEPIVADLAGMPHMLIAGTTGSGKSVCINTILVSLLLTRSPHDVQMILVDPKMVEMQQFSSVPHLMLPVVTDMAQATNVLAWAVEKMNSRYELFKDANVRHLKGFNALGEEKLREKMGDNFDEERTPRHVPYIVIVIDEMADLMMSSKKEAEQAITRLAQKSRAVGIHVIVATQRPSTDVITGVLKGNLPTRIAFQVASKIDSRVILDASGAEKLLGQGDMLYNPPRTSQLKRVQGALIEDHEIEAIVEFVSNDSVKSFNQELVQSATGTNRAGKASEKTGAEQDALFNEAVRIVLQSKRGSASLLQRALGVGYTRASRLIDIMTAEGIVGEHKGSKAREILMSLEDWEENQENLEGSASNNE
jgi:S-DNA-T family DNA segregation ATPase FtsK/SpoIIIE